MKSAIAFSVLVTSAFSAATPPYLRSGTYSGPHVNSGSPPLKQYVTLQFSNDLSDQPGPVNIDFILGDQARDVLVGADKLASSVQVVDQSHVLNGFHCDIRVLGQGDVTHHVNTINTFRSFGASVALGKVFVHCLPDSDVRVGPQSNQLGNSQSNEVGGSVTNELPKFNGLGGAQSNGLGGPQFHGD